jgi:hypothetical protein
MNTFEGSAPRADRSAAAWLARALATSMRPPVPEMGLMTTANDATVEAPSVEETRPAHRDDEKSGPE